MEEKTVWVKNKTGVINKVSKRRAEALIREGYTKCSAPKTKKEEETKEPKEQEIL